VTWGDGNGTREASATAVNPGNGRLRRLCRRITAVVAPAALIWAVWQLTAVLVTWRRGIPFPTPWETIVRLAELARGVPMLKHSVYRHTWDSLVRWATGFTISATLGLLLGLLAGWRRSIERVLFPVFYAIQLIPGLTWIPVALLLFGVGEKATIFMIAATVFSPVAINVLVGVRQIDEKYVRAARMMGVEGGRLFFQVLVPGALPNILSGLRIGLGNGWRVLVAGEMVVGAGTGLGYSILQARWTLDYTSAFACVVIICLIGFCVENLIFRPIERCTTDRWGLREEVR